MLVKIGFLGFIISNLLCLLLILLSRKNKNFIDNHKGVQNIHKDPVPRIGGLAILLSFAIGLIIFLIRFKDLNYLLLLLAVLPIFLTGLYEDLKNKLSPRLRLELSFISALLAILLLNSTITRTGIFFLDFLAKYKVIAIIFAAIAIAGMTNAINIIDGLNGLSTGSAMLFFLALGYVAFKFNDFFLLSIISLIGASILGFFIWNYPYGRIFLGDGGAYLIGYVLAVCSILLVKRNPAISPLFPILVLIYPIFETLFSIYRRKFRKRKSPIIADTLHLHSLFYRRVVPLLFNEPIDSKQTNSSTSPFLWLLCSFSIIPAVLFWMKNSFLGIFVLMFVFVYLCLYSYIVSFKFGRFIKKRFHNKN